jgi:hypothetical protein
LVTAGPGFANVFPSLISAYYAQSPVIALAGHSALRNIDKYLNKSDFWFNRKIRQSRVFFKTYIILITVN